MAGEEGAEIPAVVADSPVLLSQDAGGVRLLTLNRPSALNAMNVDLWEATTAAFAAAAVDDSVSVVVLTGAGRAFCAGQDMKEMLPGGAREGRGGVRELAAELARFPKPFICAINGIGVGFGATVAGLADLVVMSSEARLRCPFTSLGLVPELGSTFTFPQLVGRQNATWTLLSSEWLSASQCLEMGLVFGLCPPEEVLETALAHARVLAAQPLESLVESKRLVRETAAAQLEAALARESTSLRRMAGGPANQAAVARFLGT